MNNAIESLGRIRLQGILLLVAAFGVGGVAGAAVERVRASRQAPPEGQQIRRPPAPGQSPEFLEPLGLTEAQREAIAGIFQDSRSVTDSILGRSMPRLRAVADSVRHRIREVLTPEQQVQFDEMDARRRGRAPFGPRPPGPAGRRGPGRR